MKLWNKLSAINLSSNLWVCDCRLVWFLRLFRSTNVTIIEFNNVHKYKCNNPTDLYSMPLKNLTKAFEFLCFLPPKDDWLDAVIIAMVIVMMGSALVSFLHRFRWHDSYWRFVYEVSDGVTRLTPRPLL